MYNSSPCEVLVYSGDVVEDGNSLLGAKLVRSLRKLAIAAPRPLRLAIVPSMTTGRLGGSMRIQGFDDPR